MEQELKIRINSRVNAIMMVEPHLKFHFFVMVGGSPHIHLQTSMISQFIDLHTNIVSQINDIREVKEECFSEYYLDFFNTDRSFEMRIPLIDVEDQMVYFDLITAVQAEILKSMRD